MWTITCQAHPLSTVSARLGTGVQLDQRVGTRSAVVLQTTTVWIAEPFVKHETTAEVTTNVTGRFFVDLLLVVERCVCCTTSPHTLFVSVTCSCFFFNFLLPLVHFLFSSSSSLGNRVCLSGWTGLPDCLTKTDLSSDCPVSYTCENGGIY